MEEERKLTKKELKALHRLEREQKELSQESTSGNGRKWFILGIVAILFVSFFGYMIYVSKQQKKEQAAKALQTVSIGGTLRGNKNAKITIVEFGDVQCPSCGVAQPIVLATLKKRPDVNLVFKHFPISSLHPNAMAAAIAVEAAGKQGKFFEMLDMLYAKQPEWRDEPDPSAKFDEYAAALKLDVAKFDTDRKDPAIEKKIAKERDEGISLGVAGTPTFFVNGQQITNPASPEEMIQEIDAIAKP